MPNPIPPSDEPEEEHIPGYHIGSWVEADIAWRRLRAEVEGLEEENANLKASLHRDDGPCYYCKEMTSSVAGDPGRWPLRFCHSDELGVTKAHHVRCVSDRLNVLGAEREAALRAEVEALKAALERSKSGQYLFELVCAELDAKVAKENLVRTNNVHNAFDLARVEQVRALRARVEEAERMMAYCSGPCHGSEAERYMAAIEARHADELRRARAQTWREAADRLSEYEEAGLALPIVRELRAIFAQRAALESAASTEEKCAVCKVNKPIGVGLFKEKCRDCLNKMDRPEEKP